MKGLWKWKLAHKDLKKENIILDSNNTYRLTDYMLTKEINYLCESTEKKSYENLSYTAPEILLNFN